MFEISQADLKECRAFGLRHHCFRVLVHQELKGQPLSIRFAWTISSKFHHPSLASSEMRIEELRRAGGRA